MNQWIDRCCGAIEALIAAALAVMVVLVFGNVVLRYGFNSGITRVRGSLALALHLDDLPRRGRRAEGARPPRRRHGGAEAAALGKKICLAVGHVVMLYIVWLLFQGSVAQTRINWDVTAPVTGASMAVVYLSGVVFSVLAAFILALDLCACSPGASPRPTW
jgi:TRAP-type C4-dicarboxylate transport system permease small subunit